MSSVEEYHRLALTIELYVLYEISLRMHACIKFISEAALILHSNFAMQEIPLRG